MLGGYYINSGFYWGSTTGIYCAILEGEGSRRLGCGLPIGQGVHRRKSRCRDRNLNKQLFAQTAPPPLRGRGRGCGAERRQWRMQRGGAPAAVEKIEQASSAKIFSGTARRRGQIRRGYLWSASVRSTDLFFPIIEGKTIFVSSTASDRKGFVKGEAVPLDRILVPFVRTKGTPPRRAVLTMPLQKALRRRQVR